MNAIAAETPRRRSRDLRQDLVWWMWSLITLALSVFAIAAHFMVFRPMVDQWAANAMHQGSHVARVRIEEVFAQIERVANDTREWGQNRYFNLQTTAQFNQLLIPFLNRRPRIASLQIADDSGHEMLLRKMPNGQWQNRILLTVQGDIRQQWLHWQDAKTLSTEEWRSNDDDPRTQPWYRGVSSLKQETGVYWTDPYRFAGSGEPGMTAAVQWHDREDSRRYVAALDFKLLDLSHFTRELTISPNSRVAVMLPDGRLLGLPRQADTRDEADLKHSVLKTAAELGLLYLDNGIRQWQQAGMPSDEIYFFQVDGERWISHFLSIQLHNQTLVIVAMAPRSDFIPVSFRQILVFALLFAGLLLIALIASSRFARQMTRPIEELIGHSARISRLELEQPVALPASWREIDALAAAQEHMRDILLNARATLKQANADLERKVTERTHALADQLALQQALVDAIPNPIFYKGPDSRFLGCNKAYEQVFGVHSSDLIGKRVLDLLYLPEADRLAYQQEDEDTIARVAHINREMPIPFADGIIHDTLYSVTGFRNTAGQPGGLVGVIVDITPLKAAERAINESRQKAEEATRAKSMFLANMSHEIRTPMNAIIGMTHLALKTALTPKQHDYIQKIHDAGTSLLGIINDILDFSKIEAGKLDMEQTRFRFDSVLNNIATVVSQKAYDKGLELLFHTPAEIPQYLIGDPMRLGQILVNLINNAIKFTAQGQITAEARVLERTLGKIKLQFTVRDTGIGLTEDQRQRLFQAFTQADGSTTRKYGGTGLGLTICKRLVEMMGGTVWVDSTLGSGSAFSFTAWFGLSEDMLSRRPLLPKTLSGLRVLVVDDNAAARDILGEALTDFSLRVTAVASGPEAIAEVQSADNSDPYRTVFMDWRMAEMDGIEATQRIKHDRTLHSPPYVVMVSAFGREEVHAHAESVGADSFLIKPINRSLLLDTLLSLFPPETGEVRARYQRQPTVGRTALQGAYLLLAEDNEINQQITIELLESAGARVAVANHGREAVEQLRHHADTDPFHLVLMDLQMPVMDGYDATQLIRADARFQDLPIVAMTAHAMVEERQRCLSVGMNDHIAKPIDPEAMIETLGKWLRQPPSATAPLASATPAITAPFVAEGEFSAIPGLEVAAGLKRVAGNDALYRKLLGQYIATYARQFLKDRNAFLEAEVQRRTREVAAIQDVTIMAMASLAETRDNCTGNHIRRTQHYVKSLAERLQTHPRFAHFLDKNAIELLCKSAPLHDIGKVGIPDHILLKSGQLTPEEFEIMKVHTVLGRDAILAAEKHLNTPNSFLQMAREIAYSHQEHWDGTGYPDGLSGDDIPIPARLMALADVYDALISRRSYKTGMPHAKAAAIILEGRGSHFDPDIVDAFVALGDEFQAIAQRYADPEDEAPVHATSVEKHPFPLAEG